MHEDQQPMSRSLRNKAQSEEAATATQNEKGHARLIVFLVLVSLIVLSSVPVYGLITNAPKQTVAKPKTEKKSSSSSSSKKSEASSSINSSSSSTPMENSSQPAASSSLESSAQSASSSQPSSQPVQENSATLAKGQTLYNFAVTHGTTTQQVINLNPGLNANNYTQYAGQNLRVK